ncbi:hypothetical protein D3C81_1919940 [compost metagenome]
MATAADTSPSWKVITLKPASRKAAMASSCRSRFWMAMVTSEAGFRKASATATAFSTTLRSRSTQPLASGPTAIFSIYISGACNSPPRGARAITEMAFSLPSATRLVPSSGSTAISTAGPLPVPSSSPM